MLDLRLVAANQSGTHLVLRSDNGDKYLLPVDERLRAAARGDRARLGQLDLEDDARIRPRDIQARIRAGATAEQVAAAAGVSVERVQRFEGPVLAEREHMAQMAQRGALRLSGQTERASAPLGEMLEARLKPHGVRPEDPQWDSWRRDDGLWVVEVRFTVDGEQECGRFLYDPRARYVCADDDTARWLTGESDERPGHAPFVPRLASAPEAEAAPADERADEPEDARAQTSSPRADAHRAARSEDLPRDDPPSRYGQQADRYGQQADQGEGGARRDEQSHDDPRQNDQRQNDQRQDDQRQDGSPGRPRRTRVSPIDVLVPPLPGGSRPGQARHPLRRTSSRAEALRMDPTPGEGPPSGSDPDGGAPPRRRPNTPRSPGQSGTPAARLGAPPPRSDDRGGGGSAPRWRSAAGQEPNTEPPQRRTGTDDTDARVGDAESGSRRAAVPSWDDIVFGTRRRNQ